MTDSPIVRLLFIPILLIPLLACNLSAGTSLATPTAIITATPIEQSSLQHTQVPTIKEQTSVQPTEPPPIIQSVDNSTTTDDLYYVYGSHPQNNCAVQATLTTNIRISPNLSASVQGQLIGGEWVSIFNKSNGWYQVNLPNTPVHLLWISAEPTVLNNDCTCNTGGCTYNSDLFIPPTPNLDNTLFYTGSPHPAPAGICYVYTAGDFNVNIRDGQSETAPILGQLLANQWVPVRHIVNGWFGVDLPNTPVDGAYVASGPTQLVSTCQCDDISCQSGFTPASCDLSTHANTTTQIHSEPSNWSSIVGNVIPETTYRAIARSSNGWYQLETGGWIPPNFVTSTNNDSCRNLLTITYDAPTFKCSLVNTTSEIIAILKDPDGEYFGRFGVGLDLGVIKKQENWYQVYVAAYSNAGWVDGSNMSLVGECDDL
jgi:uncharacterized protein YgiM (DUF1202 family)